MSIQGIVHLKISFIENDEECVAFKYIVPDAKMAQRMDDGLKNNHQHHNHHHHHQRDDDTNHKKLLSSSSSTTGTTITGTHTDMLNGSSGVRNCSDGIAIKLDNCKPLSGDIKVEFYTKQMMSRRKTLFTFWFNTFFESERVNDGELNDSKQLNEQNVAHDTNSNDVILFICSG